MKLLTADMSDQTVRFVMLIVTETIVASNHNGKASDLGSVRMVLQLTGDSAMERCF